MFRRRPKTQNETQNETQDKTKSPSLTQRAQRNWFKISVIANIVILVGIGIVLVGGGLVYESDTNPYFCASCHLMQANVTDYLTSNNLDHIHEEAGVTCKDCHDYDIPQEVQALVDYVTNNYAVDANGNLTQRTFGDEMCTKCHISMDHVAVLTDFLYRNPHDAPGMGIYTCNDCHKSHAAQVDVCSECHDNGGQRMIGDTTPREDQIGKSSALPPSPW